MSVCTVLKINKHGKLLSNWGSCFIKVEFYFFVMSVNLNCRGESWRKLFEHEREKVTL